MSDNANDNEDKDYSQIKDRQEQITAILRDAWPRTEKSNTSFARVEAEARIISNLAWAVEKLLTCAPDINSTPEEFAGRIGDVARVIRDRAHTLYGAAKLRSD